MSYYNKTNDNFNDTSGLLEGGWDQHFNIGKKLREQLIESDKFLQPDYTQSEIFITSTSASRAILSAQAFLSGLYPDQAPPFKWLKIPPGSKSQGYNINALPQQVNYLTRLNEQNCPRYQSALQDVVQSEAFKQARGYWYTTYNQELSQLVGRPNLTEAQFDATCEYLFYSQYTNIQLNFTPTAYHRAFCQAYEDDWIYKATYGVDEQYKLQSFQFLEQLNEFAQYLYGNQTIDQMTNFQEYFKNKDGPMPKFISYFTHDEIIAGYLEGLGYHNPQGAYPAAALNFEFFIEQQEKKENFLNDGNKQVYKTQLGSNVFVKGDPNDIKVRIYYKQDINSSVPIILPGFNSEVLSITEFAAFVQKRANLSGISTNIPTACSVEYQSSGKYYDPQLSIKQLQQIYKDALHKNSSLNSYIGVMGSIFGSIMIAAQHF
eukprot:403352435